jgi:uncharacterized membrane protein (UPF0127 family)
MTIDNSEGEKVEVRVEIADDASEQEWGLMGRTELGKNRGMLFVFEEEQRLSFWMKDTRIPLSIAFMDSEGRIVDIQDMKPFDDELPEYVSAKPARYALEVNRGFFEERSVEVGTGQSCSSSRKACTSRLESRLRAKPLMRTLIGRSPWYSARHASSAADRRGRTSRSPGPR